MGKTRRVSCKRAYIIKYLCEGSPIAKLYDLDAKVLLLGVGYDKNTSIHLADARANYPGKHECIEHSAIVENCVRVWKEYSTFLLTRFYLFCYKESNCNRFYYKQ